MRVLLIATNTELEPYPVFPLGMAVIASALSAAGHEVRQADCLALGSHDAVRDICRGFRPQAVGISVRNLDNVDSLTSSDHWALDDVRAMVDLVRSACRAPIFMGGPGFSLMPAQILDHCGADFGVVGEGEAACLELLELLSAGKQPPRLLRGAVRLTGRDMHGASCDPDILGHYLRHSGIAGVQTKRGCPYGCVYCTYPMLEGRKIRAREPGAVADDIERLVGEHDVHEIFFTDSVFNDQEGHWLGLAEELVRRELNVPWSAFFQPAGMTREDLRLCRRSGLKALEMGTDAAADATLRGLRKGFDFATVERTNALCAEERLPCAHFVIFGGPGETDKTVREGLRNMERLSPAVVFAFLGIRVYTDTPLLRLAVSEGVISPEASCLEPTYYFSPHIDPAALELELTQAFKGRRDRIFPPSRGQAQMSVMRRFGFRGILWDTLVRFPQPDTATGGAAHGN